MVREAHFEREHEKRHSRQRKLSSAIQSLRNRRHLRTKKKCKKKHFDMHCVSLCHTGAILLLSFRLWRKRLRRNALRRNALRRWLHLRHGLGKQCCGNASNPWHSLNPYLYAQVWNYPKNKPCTLSCWLLVLSRLQPVSELWMPPKYFQVSLFPCGSIVLSRWYFFLLDKHACFDARIGCSGQMWRWSWNLRLQELHLVKSLGLRNCRLTFFFKTKRTCCGLLT